MVSSHLYREMEITLTTILSGEEEFWVGCLHKSLWINIYAFPFKMLKAALIFHHFGNLPFFVRQWYYLAADKSTSTRKPQNPVCDSTQVAIWIEIDGYVKAKRKHVVNVKVRLIEIHAASSANEYIPLSNTVASEEFISDNSGSNITWDHYSTIFSVWQLCNAGKT
jgi:hypothetical protein